MLTFRRVDKVMRFALLAAGQDVQLDRDRLGNVLPLVRWHLADEMNLADRREVGETENNNILELA